jgi:uncharacterized membrane protein
MPATIAGLFTGLILGLTLAFGGFTDMILVAFLGVIGLVVGKAIDGQLDLSPYLSGRSGSRQR